MQIALNPLKFEDIKAQIIQYLNAKNEYAGQFDFSNANISYFVDTMTYVTMMMSYNTSHVANNMFLDTTEIRKNAVSIAKQMGYKPKRPYSAKLQGTLIYKGSNFDITNTLTIPARSPFAGEFGNVYTNLKPITLTYKGNPTQLEADYVLTEGTFHKYKATATGEGNFSFTINNPNIDEDNFSLYVLPATEDTSNIDSIELTNYSQYAWSLVKTFFEIVSNNIYFMEEDIIKEGYAKIVFGNGAIGNIPTGSETIICEYLETKGAAANNEGLISIPPADKLGNTFLYYNTNNLGESNKALFSVSNFDSSIYQNKYNKSFGGTNLETLESIKYNAPRFYSFVGRTVSKNDYVYYLNSLAGIKSANVTSGVELYPNDDTKLGNIYLSMVPNINQSEFLYGNNIYLNSEFENEIKVKLDNYSIISTKRHIYKPTYVMVDVTPNIEIGTSVPKSEQNKLQDQVKFLLETHFVNHFNELGVLFRESKISAAIDSLASITSSYLDLAYYFVMNNRTVENLQAGVNNFMYLPIRNVKDEAGTLTGFTNFIKTNSQVIKEDLYPDVDWAILSKTGVLTDAEQALYDEKLKLLNNILFNITGEQCSISCDLLSPKHNRVLYNRDYKDTTVANLWLDNTVLRHNTVSFKDQHNNNIGVSITVRDVEGNPINFINFSKYDKASNTTLEAEVARIIYTASPFDIKIALDDASHHRENLIKFNIDESSYVFDGLPFEILKTNSTHFSIKMRLQSYTTQLGIDGTNTIFNIFEAFKGGATTEVHQVASYGKKASADVWSFTHEAGQSHGTIKYNNIDNAIVELSHLGFNDKFKGFIQDELGYDDILLNMGLYAEGDYFIVLKYFSALVGTTYQFFKKNEVLFIKNNTIERATIKKTVSTKYAGNLITQLNQGDLFLDDLNFDPNTDPKHYVMFDVQVEGVPNFSPVVMKDPSWLLDASQSLPTALVDNRIVRLVKPETGTYTVDYAIANVGDVPANKLHVPLYKRDATGNLWTELPDRDVYDGDVLIYNGSDEVQVGGGWFLLENIYNTTTTGHRISYGADSIINLNSLATLSSETWTYRILKIAANMMIPLDKRDLFNSIPADGGLILGDYIILTPNGKWTVFDDDFYEFQIDVGTNNCAFPEPLNHGDVFSVVVSDTVTNFQGKTQTVSFANGDKIIYFENDGWKKFIVGTDDIPYSTVINADAVVGDMVQVIDSGNFENSSKISAPLWQGNKVFDYNDVLYYTGSSWVKVKPINIYNIEDGVGTNKAVLNRDGFNSDYYINFTTGNYYDICLNDIYHDSIIGELDYYTGKLELFPVISGKLNKLVDVPADGNNNVLTAIFKEDNYRTYTTQMDKIKIKPVRRSVSVLETDFDTNFNQFIIANVMDTKIIK
jgi:hypothetical protein